MIQSEKQRLREKMRSLARESPRGDPSPLIRLILDHDAWRQSANVLMYYPLPGEPDLMMLADDTDRSGKNFFFPRIDGGQIAIYRRLEGSRWVSGPFGLSEPDPESWKEASSLEIDMVLVPGVAFDRSGRRLGRGKGFYDRLLGHPAFGAIKIGVAWPWQMVESVPVESHDVRMDLLMAGGESHLPEGSRLDKSGERE